LTMNEYQKIRFAKRIVETIFDSVKGKSLAILGIAFKKNTGDIRDSAALDICRFLLDEKAELNVYDPKVESVLIVQQLPGVTIKHDAYSAIYNTHAIIILTEWEEFRNLDYSKIYATMQKPAFVFDGRNILDHKRLQKIGFNVVAIGKSFQ